VKGARNLMLSFLHFLNDHRDEVVKLVGDADRRTVERGLNPSGQDVFVIDNEPVALARKLTIAGYEMEVTDTGGRYPEVKPTTVKRTYDDVPYLARYAARRTARLPRGYLVTTADPVVIGKLLEHGLVVERLVEPVTLEVEAFTVTRLKGAEVSDQGHFTSTVEGAYAAKAMTFPAGTHFVTTAQPLGRVAAQLLEPESTDGLVSWNFLDRYLAFQWIPRPMEAPVYKLHQPARLVTETLR
jgi:hypothetical protein